MGKSYKEIIELLDCNQTTIWRNVKKYEEFGLDSLLQETRGGRNHAYMTVEEEKAFLASTSKTLLEIDLTVLIDLSCSYLISLCFRRLLAISTNPMSILT
ncbi:transposase [Streptococcus pneumoniae]|nr:transposase [Streptococcus pneumoniae]